MQHQLTLVLMQVILRNLDKEEPMTKIVKMYQKQRETLQMETVYP